MSNSKQTMKDVSHTPRTGDSVTNVWERGHEQTADADE
jgi:hypothetical protein